LQLTTSAPALKAGQSSILTATASATMTGTRTGIEIFDLTTSTLAGACMQASQCQVGYAARSGVHTFNAYITQPTANRPTGNAIASNPVIVSWFGVTLSVDPTPIVAPGTRVTVTASATADVASAGYQLGLYDQATGTRLTYCSTGTTCSTTLTKARAGSSSIVAYVATASATLPPSSVKAQSAPIRATWMGVTLDANTTAPQVGNTVFMRATANIDVTNTPWSIGIYDEQGSLVSNACKTGTTCTALVTIAPGPIPSFTAVIGAVRPLLNETSSALVRLVQSVQAHSSFVSIQARSHAVQPARLLWGVDSCKPFTRDPTGVHGLYGQVIRYYGYPDFWGRYLTNTYNCPGISPAEVAAAAHIHMGILPIYNNYDCSAVHGYATGLQYATEASAAATNLGIPQGSVLAVDIEPPGPYCPGAASVDAGFIEGWFDGITATGFAPMYYGNGTAGSEFGNAWCGAVAARPEVALASYLWSFEPSLWGRFTRASAPGYSPQQPGCTANLAAWQYVLSSGSRPDVDSDEAISKLPLWYPGAAN
jgi:hypothetical protein